MKRLFFLALVMVMTMAASAQITWNAKAGAGVATLWGSDATDSKSHFVAKAGVGIEKPLTANWSLMPSFEVAWKGVEYSEGDVAIDILYLQIPFVAAYRMNLTDSWNMTLKAGPYVAYSVYNHLNSDYGSESNLDINKFDAGLDAGIDFEHHRFVFGLEAEMGFLNLVDDWAVKNLAFYVTIGYKF